MDLAQLGRALAAFAAHEPTHMPLHHAQLFIEVAHRGRATYRDLEEALGLSNASISRTVTALAETHRTGRPGFNLLETCKDPVEARRLLVRLSAKGKALARQIEGI